MAAGELVLGIILALGGGASLALAMVTQRYALSFPPGKVPFLGCSLPRNAVWFIGLLIYGAANGLYAVAQLFGPLSLLAGVFTTLLIWNMLFAKLLLGEELTHPRIVGAMVILLGVIMCVVATPAEVETEFTPKDIEDLSSRAAGATYIAILVALVLASVAAISWYEAKYPTHASTQKGDGGKAENSSPRESETSWESSGSAVTIHVGKDESNSTEDTHPLEVVEGPKEGAHAGGQASQPVSISIQPIQPVSVSNSAGAQAAPTTAAETTEAPTSSGAKPPAWLDRIMGLVYPGSLGLDEGIAHLTMKAAISMLDACGDVGQCGSATMFVFLGVWVLASLATLWWLRRVFSRYETTQALPIEYGTVNAVSACSGLLFYREASMMEGWQLPLMLVGVAVVLVGIGLGRREQGAKEEGGEEGGAGGREGGAAGAAEAGEAGEGSVRGSLAFSTSEGGRVSGEGGEVGWEGVGRGGGA